MSEDVREHVDRALEQAVATGADLDDVEAILEDGLNRLDELATERGHHRVRDEAIEPPVDDLGLNQHLAE